MQIYAVFKDTDANFKFQVGLCIKMCIMRGIDADTP